MMFVPRILIRFGLFGVSTYFLFLNPMIFHMIKLRDYFNEKYTGRMRLYNREMDPLILNPFMLNEPGMSEDEKDYMKVFYENMKSQAAMMKAQMKMMEEKEKSKGKI